MLFHYIYCFFTTITLNTQHGRQSFRLAYGKVFFTSLDVYIGRTANAYNVGNLFLCIAARQTSLFNII